MADPLPRPHSRLDDDPRDDEKLAYAAGRRDAEVDVTLRSHEKRLNAINGSIERHAQATFSLGQKVDAQGERIEAIDGKLDQVVATLATNAAVEQDRVKQVRDANEKQISSRTFWVGVAAICATLIVGFATVYTMLHTAGVH